MARCFSPLLVVLLFLVGCDSGAYGSVDSCESSEVGLITSSQEAVLLAGRSASLCITEADVAFFLGEDDQGQTVGASAAATLISQVLAAESYYLLSDRSTGQVHDRVREHRNAAYTAYRQAAADAGEARAEFERAYAMSYNESGLVNLETAYTWRCLVRAVERFSGGVETGLYFEILRYARIGAAYTNAHAMHEAFVRFGASASNTQWVDNAAATWLVDLRAAQTILDQEQADVGYNSFPDGVHSPLVFASGVSSPDLTAAEIATSGRRLQLFNELAASTTPLGVATAVESYYDDARLIVDLSVGNVSLATDGILLSSASAASRLK